MNEQIQRIRHWLLLTFLVVSVSVQEDAIVGVNSFTFTMSVGVGSRNNSNNSSRKKLKQNNDKKSYLSLPVEMPRRSTDPSCIQHGNDQSKQQQEHHQVQRDVLVLKSANNESANDSCWNQRRHLLAATITTSCALIMSSLPAIASAEADDTDPVITDKIYIDVKGLPIPEGDPAAQPKQQRIVIGLYGKDAPSSVAKIKQLVSHSGLPASCRPKAERALQKEQLEANKVYNSCIEKEDVGVSLRYSTIWRIIKNERIDLGAVTGKFVAREYPVWNENIVSTLKHDKPGIVSVRRGGTSGFGFTIYPGGGSANELDEEHIIVGKVVDGLEIIKKLNDIPVIASSKVNYMGFTGGPKTNSAPDRSCRYGGPMYCNENKPLVKLTISDTGIM